MKKAELLAPAGNMEKFKMALHYGADAVFMGGKMFNLRAGSNNFSDKELEEAVKLYDAESRKLDILKKDLEDATAQYKAVKTAYEAELLKKAEEERKQIGGRNNVINPILAGNGEYIKSTTKHEQNIKVNVQTSKEFTTTKDVASTQYNANEVATDALENGKHKELPKTGELVSVLGFYGLALLGGVAKLKKRDEQ